jgi:DNA-binding SARP family transcriptional activator/TolB-like protein
VDHPRSDSPRRIRLRTLGAIDLIDSDGKEVRSLLAQSKRLALLVYLALAPPPHFRRRDTVLALFWPDLDDEHARGALRQALSYLRQTLGADTVVTRGVDDIGVSPTLLECDVSRFEQAVAAGDAGTALALYTGNFLEGLHVSDNAQEFDEWIAGERARLRTIARNGARALADRARQLGDAAGEEHWARRSYELAGRDELELARLLRLLDAKGERAGALQLYEDFVRRIKQDVDAEPSPETQALIAQIRARTLASASAMAPLSREPPPDDEHEPLGGFLVAGTRRRGRLPVVAALAALTALGTVGVAMAKHETAALDPRRVAVARFENKTGDAALDPLGDVAADYLERGLAETKLVTVVDARAAQRAAAGMPARSLVHALGAGSVIRGSYYRRGDSLAFEVQLTDARTDAVIRSIEPAAAPMSAPVQAIAAISQHVMAAFAARFDPQYSEYQGASQPTIYEASQEFLAGDQYRLREGAACITDCYGEELDHYRRAYALDSNFTLPLARAAFASWMAGDCIRTDSVAAYLRPRHDRLVALDRLTLDGAVAACHGERTHALELARAAVVINPHSDAAAIWLGYLARKSGRFRESIVLMQALDTARSRSHRVYWGNVTISYHMLGEHAPELAMVERSRREHPNSVEGIAFEARALVGLGRLAEVRQRLDEMLNIPTNVPQVRVAAVWIDEVGGDLDAHGYPDEARSAYTRAVDWCRARPATELKGSEDDCARALYRARHFEEARKVFARLARQDPEEVEWQSFLGVIAAHTGDRREVERVDRWLTARRGPYLEGSPTFERARIAAVLGDRERAVTLRRLAVDQGATVFGMGFGLHSDPDFRSLRGYAPFEALMRPKD